MQIRFQSAEYLRLQEILPKLDGIIFEWNPDSKNEIATFYGDPIEATIAAVEDGELTKEQGDFMFEILHPDRRYYGHGGKRPNAGRKPRHGEPMVQKTVRLPQEWIDSLDEFGTFQAAIETLVKNHLD